MKDELEANIYVCLLLFAELCCHSCEQWGSKSKSKWEQVRKGKSGVGDQDVSGVGQVDAAPS